jgi:PAS domain S-box-containing protein
MMKPEGENVTAELAASGPDEPMRPASRREVAEKKGFEGVPMNKEARNSRSSPIRLLLIEDNEHDQFAFERSLRNSETAFEISVCERAEEALEILTASRDSFDIVVVDYDLPGITGMDFYRKMQHMNRLPPFVMLTGAGSENLAVEALQAGFYDYIIKDPGQGYLPLLPLKLADVKQRKSDRRARRKAQVALKKARDELEDQVAKRTAELLLTVQALEREVAEHQLARQQISIAYDALNSARSGIIITGADQRIRFANPACLRMFNYNTASDIIGIDASDLFSEGKNRKFGGLKLVALQSIGETQEFVAQHPDGTEFPVEAAFSEVADSDGVVVGKMASLLDITVRKKTEAALLESEGRLRELSHKILDAQENERRVVSQDIHDSISSSLAAIKMFMEQKVISMTGGPSNSDLTLEKIISMITDTIQETRRISAHLRPSILDDLGLCATIDWFCREFEKHYPQIQVVRQLEIEEDDVAEQSKVVVYRILQEAMNNLAKHSEADRVHISLAKFGNELKLCVADNGCGFDFEQIVSNRDPLSGHGLSNMRDRAEICGGKLEIRSKPKAGTTVELMLSCDSMSRVL